MKKFTYLLFLPFIGCSGGQTTTDENNSDSSEQNLTTEQNTETTDGEINDNLPNGWFKAGEEPNSYEMGLDQSILKTGNNSAYIESKKDRILGFGTMMQTSSAKEYLGKRIKMTAYLKTENAEDWSGMWLRIDPEHGHEELGFDNMQDRAITGTTDWTKCEIVLDVPMQSWTLNYGVLLSGTGKVWFDDFTFEVVDKNVPTTELSYLTSKSVLEAPENIGFEE